MTYFWKKEIEWKILREWEKTVKIILLSDSAYYNAINKIEYFF